ncbi:MAG: M20 family metallopeptidase [Phycisphaerales bacterium]|nr:M20 family metallopeptidase [Phycisphaerales bacterium]
MDTTNLSLKIRTLAKQYLQEFIAVRRHIHQHPELSYQEFQTSNYIKQQLQELGIPFQVLAKTGVVGLIQGKDPHKRTVALRADMDALPIIEENQVPYCSKNKGVMHACGHDVHTACLLGAAKILQTLKEEWYGTIKLIFQLGEEKNPGGASLMIQEGVLENPTPSCIFGLHVHTDLEVGKISMVAGPCMASADEIYVTVKGQGGSIGLRHQLVDTPLITSQIILSLQQIISRRRPTFSPSVLSISSITGGDSFDTIPSSMSLKGTFRALDNDWRLKAHDLIKQTVTGVAHALGGEVDLSIDKGYPVLVNNPQLYEHSKQQAIDFLGKEQVLETEIRLGAEDFSYYAQKIPACFYRLGVRSSNKKSIPPVHTALFDIDEQAIETGMAMMSLFGAIGDFKKNS